MDIDLDLDLDIDQPTKTPAKAPKFAPKSSKFPAKPKSLPKSKKEGPSISSSHTTKPPPPKAELLSNSVCGTSITVKKEEDAVHPSSNFMSDSCKAQSDNATEMAEARLKTEGERLNSEPMDIDNKEEEEEDVIVSEYDVYFTKPPIADDTSLYVLQYPLRPCWRPYELDQRCTEVRIKPVSREVEVDLSIDNECDNFNSRDYDAENMKTQTLGTTWSAPKRTGYAVGVMIGRKLYLNPVRSVVQLRPSMGYLNPSGSKKKTAPVSNVKAEGSARNAPGGTAKKQTMEMNPGKAESWVPLEYHNSSSDLAVRYVQNMMVVEDSSQLQFSMNPYDYMNSLCPRAAINQMKTNGSIKKSLLALPLEERFKKWLAEGPPVQRFSALLHLAPDEPVEDVLRILQQFARLVQGLWVPKATIRHPKYLLNKSPDAWDHVLLLFSRNSIIKSNQLDKMKDILSVVAIERKSFRDWKFKEPTDASFIKLHPEIVQEQEKLWQDREREILGSLPQCKLVPKGIVKTAKEARPLSITMSHEGRKALPRVLRKLFQTHKVCTCPFIRKGLEHMALKETSLSTSDKHAAVTAAKAPEEELQAVISEIAVYIHGVYVLKESPEHPECSPLRSVVIDLFIGRGADQKIKKSEVFEAAKIKLGKEPSISDFQKVMTELCDSRGGGWLLKPKASLSDLMR